MKYCLFYIPIQSLTQTNSNLPCSSSLKQNPLAFSVGDSVLDLDLVTNTYKSRHSSIYPTRNNSFRVWELSCFFKFMLWHIFNLLNYEQKSKNVWKFFCTSSSPFFPTISLARCGVFFNNCVREALLHASECWAERRYSMSTEK